MIKKQEAFDIIVIGSGGAGLRAAVGAANKGAKTLIISKGKVNRSGATLLAGANISADIALDGKSMHEMGISDINKNDSKEAWFEDTLHEGFYLNNEELVKVFVDTAADRVKELVDWGLVVRGIEGERGISVFGSDILDVLLKKAKSLGVEILEDTIFTDLVVEDGNVKGVICLDLLEGTVKYIPSKAVVLATGGAHNIFSNNSGGTDLCGEGQAAALRAGAELVDMEMISFCPTVMVYPDMYKGNILPYIFTSFGVATLKNRFGATFTDKYLSKDVERLALDTEWNKMLLSYAIQSEINSENSTMHGGVYCVLNDRPTNVKDELYNALPSLSTGIYADLMKLFEGGKGVCVAPSAHYFEGGIKIDSNMATNIKGLYAAGECTGGLFGANRVSAATTEMLVEGAVAGDNAWEYVSTIHFEEASQNTIEYLANDIFAPFKNNDGYKSSDLIKELHKATTESLYVIRNNDDLSKSLEDVIELKNNKLHNINVKNKSYKYNREWLEYLELRNMIPVASAILKSALLRKESRGVHIRKDYLYTDNDNFLKNIVIENENLDYRLEDVKNSKAVNENGRIDYSEYVEKVVERLSI